MHQLISDSRASLGNLRNPKQMLFLRGKGESKIWSCWKGNKNKQYICELFKSSIRRTMLKIKHFWLGTWSFFFLLLYANLSSSHDFGLFPIWTYDCANFCPSIQSSLMISSYVSLWWNFWRKLPLIKVCTCQRWTSLGWKHGCTFDTYASIERSFINRKKRPLI